MPTKMTAFTEADRRDERAKKQAFGRRFKLARKASHLNQSEIAKALELSRAAVSQWERGHTIPAKPNLQRAAAMMNVSADWLAENAGPEPEVLSKRANGYKPGRWSKASAPPFEGGVAEVASGIGGGVPLSPLDETAEWWRLPPTQLQELRTDVKRLRMLRVHSNAMAPAIRQGSFVLVDLSQTAPANGHVYAVNLGFAPALKRVVIDVHNTRRIGLRDDKVADGHGEPQVKWFAYKSVKSRIIGRICGKFTLLHDD